MTDTSQKASLDQFIAVTGETAERATFFLDAARWNLQAALGAFFEEEGPSVPLQESQSLAGPPGPPATAAPRPAGSGSGRVGVASLADYQEEAGGVDDDSEKFFAGGSERSGQLIAGPPRKKANVGDMATDLFKAAKEHGAVSVDEEEEEERESRKPARFAGAGFRLGDSEGPSSRVGVASSPQAPPPVQHVLSFWANGFSVDQGPLRDGQTDQDRVFLDSVTRGEIPQELVRSAKGGKVDIHIEDKRNDPYVAQAPPLVAFSGEGRKLGSLAPSVVSPASLAPAASPAAPPSVPLDPSQTATSVQIRLVDGTRLVAKFNPTHTVSDIRHFINLSRPALSSVEYVLMTTFPNKELSDPSQSLREAGLLNAVIVQRIK